MINSSSDENMTILVSALLMVSIAFFLIGRLSRRQTNSEETQVSPMKVSVLTATFFSVLILLVYGLYLVQRSPMTGENVGIAWYAQYGDAFGVVTSFFTALGTIGLIATILLQYQTLNAQKEELKETRKEIAGQRQELAEQNKTMIKQGETAERQAADAFYVLFMTEYPRILANTKSKLNVDKIHPELPALTDLEQGKITTVKTRVKKPGAISYAEYVNTSLSRLTEEHRQLFLYSISDKEIQFLLLLSVLSKNKYSFNSKMLSDNFAFLEEVVSLRKVRLYHYEARPTEATNKKWSFIMGLCPCGDKDSVFWQVADYVSSEVKQKLIEINSISAETLLNKCVISGYFEQWNLMLRYWLYQPIFSPSDLASIELDSNKAIERFNSAMSILQQDSNHIIDKGRQHFQGSQEELDDHLRDIKNLLAIRLNANDLRDIKNAAKKAVDAFLSE